MSENEHSEPLCLQHLLSFITYENIPELTVKTSAEIGAI